MELKELIKKKTDAIFPEVVQHYRWMHQHPELSFQERGTSAYIADFLLREGIPFKRGIGGEGILVTINGTAEGHGKCMAFVADMDALPVVEMNNVPYKSIYNGVMHACGHDAQAASLMGAVKLLYSLRNWFAGTALCVFQPGEERSPGGANLMLKEGLFDDLEPDFVIKQHAYADLPAGMVGFNMGTIMASADEVHIIVKGQGGHGALPHELNDTVLAASQIIVAMQQLVSRRANPFNPMVLSFGKFIADGATNVIPNEVTLAGSLRCMQEGERNKMLQLIPQIAIDTAAAYGCSCEVELPQGYPSVISHEQITELMRKMTIDFLGEERVSEFPKRMTADDFGFFSQRYPSCYYRFGVDSEHVKIGPLHSGTFLIDELALKTSTALSVWLTLNSLK